MFIERAMVSDVDWEFGLEKHRWERPVTTIQAPFFPAHMAFHAYDPHLVITNETDTVRYVVNDMFFSRVGVEICCIRSVYDWRQRRRMAMFCNGNPRGTSITSLHLINQDVGGIILTGSGEISSNASPLDASTECFLQRTVL